MSEARDSSCPSELVEARRQVVEANRAAGSGSRSAESCTGGLVAAALTEIAGSSDVLEAGFVTYSNEAKIELLGVSEEVLETFGAVSIAVAWGMAQGALARAEPTWRWRSPALPARRRQRTQAGRHRGLRPRPRGPPTPRRSSPTPRCSATSAAAASAFRRRSARSSC